MNAPTPTTPTIEDMLTELASHGMRASRVVTRLMEIELASVEVIAAWLPEPRPETGSLTENVTAGQAVDAMNAAMKETVPRIEILTRAEDRMGRLVRRTVALIRRIQAGWTGAGRDDRAAMVRRQVARGVGEAIRRETDGDAAERLFDELAERLEDPALETEIGTLPVEDVVRRICRELGLVTSLLEAAVPVRPDGARSATDTG